MAFVSFSDFEELIAAGLRQSERQLQRRCDEASSTYQLMNEEQVTACKLKNATIRGHCKSDKALNLRM
jgi:hypothetical protein